MSFMFLHPEFFLWMLPPLGFLFYVWQTQKQLESRWLNESVLERLRADAMTMGLKGRNTLFFIAGILLLGAMAQPVLVDENPLTRPKANVIVAIEAGTDSPDAFDRTKSLALKTLKSLQGEKIALLAFDQNVYRIAPLTRQNALLISLVEDLNFGDFTPLSERTGVISKLASSGSLKQSDAIVIINASGVSDTIREGSLTIDVIGAESDILPALQRIREEVREHQRRYHIPLFYYPLGMAMVLILIALSSMSRRQSVPLTAVLMAVGLNEPSSYAGILDFQLLRGANSAYEEGRYIQSAALFAAYQENHDSAQVRYNRANALYKAGRFKEAAYWYREVHTTDPVLGERTRYNLERSLACIPAKRDAQREQSPEKREQEHPSAETKEVKHVGKQAGKIRLFRYE